MPITPTQARIKRSQSIENSREFKYACEEIDDYLASTKLPAYWDCREVSGPVLEKIISTYTSQGWKVQHLGDIRDGNCLVFED